MRLRRLLWKPAVVLATLAAVVLGPVFFVAVMAAGQVEDSDAAREAPVAMVLGASVHRDGRPSAALAGRLDTALDLYRAGKVRVILVSGDNRTETYNEPAGMKTYLVAHGVPSDKVVADFAGRSTYDSCFRAQAIFGLSRLVVVSQDYHVPRAVATCRSLGIEATGVGDTSFRANHRTWSRGVVREVPAAFKLTADLLTSRTPILGAPEQSVAFALGD